jgi:NAD(P)H-flavin reductase
MGRAVHAILDGPYGGPTLDTGTYGAVLLLAGGSGATATLGHLDDLVGRCIRRGRAGGERTRRVEWVWCVRNAGTYLLIFLMLP